MFFVFFFFKQKTAYEMRISDWSSDVCSSDLLLFVVVRLLNLTIFGEIAIFLAMLYVPFHMYRQLRGAYRSSRFASLVRATLLLYRSEEHTSELQSLMRISYAVFCLQKQTHFITQLTLIEDH